MPTDVISKIGATNSPTPMDYSTLQAWEDAAPTKLTTSDQRWIGECYDQGTFTAGVSIAGSVTDSTRYPILRCATGASFSDKSGVRSVALAFNSSNGVTIESTGTPITSSENYLQIDGIQARRTASYGDALSVTGTNTKVTNCIFKSTLVASRVCLLTGASSLIANCLVQVQTDAVGIYTQGTVANCSVVATGHTSTSAAFGDTYNSRIIVKNCAVFGFNSFSFVTTATGTDYNATDKATAGLGSHNQTSLTYASQFVSSTTDWRAVDTGSLKNGTPDATNAPLDISKYTRDGTTPFIGCWEVAAAAAGLPRISTIEPQAIQRAANW